MPAIGLQVGFGPVVTLYTFLMSSTMPIRTRADRRREGVACSIRFPILLGREALE